MLASVACLGSAGAVLAAQHDMIATLVVALSVVCGALAALVAGVEDAVSRQRVVEYRPIAAQAVATARDRLLLDHTPVPLLFETAGGTLHVANRAARQLFATDDRITRPDDALCAAVADARPGERSVVTFVLGGATRRFALTTAQTAAHITAHGGPTRLIALTDIDAELHVAEAGILRGLMEVLSHEIMNSLTPIVSLAQTALEIEQHSEPGEHTALREALVTMERRARGLDRFVQGYRQIARIPVPKREVVDLGAVLAAAAMMFRARWSDRVAFDVSAPDIAVFVELDCELIDQALISLLNNAAEASLEGVLPARVGLAAQADRDHVEIDILDSGPGVPAEQREAIFRPFVSLKPGGSGIGLTVARQIALAHGGDLRLADAPMGWATRFCLSL